MQALRNKRIYRFQKPQRLTHSITAYYRNSQLPRATASHRNNFSTYDDTQVMRLARHMQNKKSQSYDYTALTRTHFTGGL